MLRRFLHRVLVSDIIIREFVRQAERIADELDDTWYELDPDIVTRLRDFRRQASTTVKLP